MTETIIVLSGSPRENGNSELLAKAFVEGAEAAGKRVLHFSVAGLEISGCTACEYCTSHNGICAQEDAMNLIIEMLRVADALVLVSPIYYFSVCGQLKLAIDRMYALSRSTTPIKKAALLLTCGDDTETVAAGAVTMYQNICHHLKWEDAGIIIATDLSKTGEINGRVELEQAKALGQMI